MLLLLGAWLWAWQGAGRVGAELTRAERAECVMWNHLENKTMPLQDQGMDNVTSCCGQHSHSATVRVS